MAAKKEKGKPVIVPDLDQLKARVAPGGYRKFVVSIPVPIPVEGEATREFFILCRDGAKALSVAAEQAGFYVRQIAGTRQMKRAAKIEEQLKKLDPETRAEIMKKLGGDAGGEQMALPLGDAGGDAGGAGDAAGATKPADPANDPKLPSGERPSEAAAREAAAALGRRPRRTAAAKA